MSKNPFTKNPDSMTDAQIVAGLCYFSEFLSHRDAYWVKDIQKRLMTDKHVSDEHFYTLRCMWDDLRELDRDLGRASG